MDGGAEARDMDSDSARRSLEFGDFGTHRQFAVSVVVHFWS